MSNTQTKIDTRDFDDFKKSFQELVPYYTDEWSVNNNDFGSALSNSFFYILDSIIKRLNKIPEKNFIEFLNLYGIKLVSAQPSTVPVTFTLSDRVKNDVLVKKETQLISTTDDGEEVLFFTNNDLLVSRAKLSKIFGFDKHEDKISNLKSLSDPDSNQLLSPNKNLQKHELFLGHSDLFNIKKHFSIIVELVTDPENTQILHDLLSDFSDWEICNIDKKTKSEKNISLTKNVSTLPDSVRLELVPNDDFSEIQKLEVNSISSRWLKCIFSPSSRIPKINVRDIRVQLQSSLNDAKPERLYSNDLNFPDKINFYPFGKKPAQNNIFYIADSDTFSKRGHSIKIQIHHKDSHSLILSDFQDRTISWEYWNGKNWTELSTTSISQDRKYRNLVVLNFVCPLDIDQTTVNGYDSFWIRARLASGNYGVEKFVVKKIDDDQWTTESDTSSILPPFVEKISIVIETSNSPVLPHHCVTNNNLILKNQIKNDVLLQFPILEYLHEIHDCVFLGFDENLSKGPFQIFVNILKNFAEKNIVDKSKFYYVNSSSEWKQMDVEDETNSLMKSGVVRFQLPIDFTKSNLFGHQLYWLKIENSQSLLNQIVGIFPNAVICHNSQTTREVIGSSDSLPGQEFKIKHSPTFKSDFKLWVNEYGFLSDDDESLLKKTKKLIEVKDENSKILEQWVLWDEVSRLDASNAFDRHFVIDRVSKLVIFGDGTHGKIPPSGSENIKTKYTFGGGKNGNLPRNSISELKTAVPFVEKVTNPLPSEGGLDMESIERATLRGPHSVKNRGRAITRDDYEWLVLENFPSVAKVRCLPASKSNGEICGGNVTIVIVPSSNEQKPVPTHTLLENISTYLQTVNSNVIQNTNFSVISPVFVKISISVDMHPKSISLYHKAETEALLKIEKFLHPLYGGSDGHGWEFGALPCMSEIYELLNPIPEIDHLDNLSIKVSVEDPEHPYDFIIGDTEASVPLFSLIYGNHHEIRPLSMEITSQ